MRSWPMQQPTTRFMCTAVKIPSNAQDVATYYPLLNEYRLINKYRGIFI